MSGFSVSQSIIAAMITPALLIMASGSLIATALVRLGRVIDRVRKLGEAGAPAVSADEMRRHERRADLAERAVTWLFCAVVCFVLAGFTIPLDHLSGDRLTWLPVLITTIGMGLIVAGCGAMLLECRLASAQIRAEIGGLVAIGARRSDTDAPAARWANRPDP